MKIVADENIPLIEHFFGANNELLTKPGRTISRDDLFDADMLLVRSVTKVDELLLHNTPVKFVGSSTSGADHLDTEWLDQSGIQWRVAVGCNAMAVAEYVVSIIAALQKQGFLLQKNPRAGVVGVGTIGSLVVEKLKLLGFEVVQCDPLRIDDPNFSHTELEKFSELDFISLHTPMTYQGKFPTHHLIEKNFLQKQKKDCVLVNAGRGSVINFEDLKKQGQHLHWCLDVWEHEPEIDSDVLERAWIATPHIAGYSVQSKYRGIEMIYHAAYQAGFLEGELITSPRYPEKIISEILDETISWQEVLLKTYDPIETSKQMKQALQQKPNSFDQLRKHFNHRNEFGYMRFSHLNCRDLDLLAKLGFKTT